MTARVDVTDVAIVVALGLVFLLQIGLGRLGSDGRRRPRSRPRLALGQWAFPAAVVTGGALRLLWVVIATREATTLRDPAEYLRIASSLTHGVSPRFGGVGDPSAFWPPGYPAVLSPFVWLSDQTGWISPTFTASLVNVVAGTASIALAAYLADQWIGRHTRAVTAWLVALWPALIFWTSTPHTETVFTAAFLAVIALSTKITKAADDRGRPWVVVGLLIGMAVLVRTPGAIGLAIPLLVVRASAGSWRQAVRATGLALLGAAVLLVPWTVRNGLQVGVWTPGSTNNAVAVCFGHGDGADPLWQPDRLDPELERQCLQHSVYDDRRLADIYRELGMPEAQIAELGEPDEARWYADSMSRALRWAAGHPVEEVELSIRKVWATWSNEGRPVDGARNYAEPDWAGRWHDPLGRAADIYLWIVGALALLGMATVARCRRALPVWVPILLFTLAIVGGVVSPHYRYPAVPLVAALAAGFLRSRSSVATQPGPAPADPERAVLT